MSPDNETQEREFFMQLDSKRHIINTLGEDGFNVADYWEKSVKNYSQNPAIKSVDSKIELSYQQLDDVANTIAKWSLQFINDQNKTKSRVVCFLSKNIAIYPAVTIGLAKTGFTAALINNNLKGAFLKHAIDIAQPIMCIVEESSIELLLESYYAQQAPEYRVIYQEPNDDKLALAWQNKVDYMDHKPFRAHVNDRDPFVYIYTSGTSGPSKAAKFSHRRWIGCGVTWTLPTDVVSQTSYYIPLPLYHGNGGAIALSTVFLNGLCAVIREKFSVSCFWEDIVEYQCRYMIHVGELWRYICTLPSTSVPSEHPLRVVVGNGLRESVWRQLYTFGVTRVVEHYGSTEMPGDAVLQWFNKVGSCGYVPPAYSHLHSGIIVQYNADLKVPVRTQQGLCVKVPIGEVGELVMPLADGRYDGYVDNSQTVKKLYSSVIEQGDTWFSTGDLLKVDLDGFYYFIDRTGDTFRWKGENVATTEVENVITSFPSIVEANVFGVAVPQQEGKAGMLVLTLRAGLENADQLDMHQLSAYVFKNLPYYAVPLFVRILQGSETEKTSTMKYQKTNYAQQGYNLAAVTDPLYIWDKSIRCYKPFNTELHRQIQEGALRL